MNVNKSIFRTMKVFNLKTPYLKITSLNKEKRFNNNNSINDAKLADEQKSINIIFPQNNEITEKMISPISKKRIKIMKDSETNTDPITEIADNCRSLSNKNNVYRQNYKLIKSEESPNSITDKIVSLQKKLEQHSNHSITYRNTFYNNNNNLKIPEITNTKFKAKNKRNFSSSMKNTNINNNLNKKILNLGRILKEAKNENKENKEKMKDIFFRHYNIKNNYTINNIFNYTNHLNYNNRNIISAISLSKKKDVEKTHTLNENTYFPLYNKLSYEKKNIKKNNEYNNINEIINRNSLIKVRERNTNIKTMKGKEKENKKYNLRHKNIKFTPCIYNLFNVPVIENNNSLEETIKQQTVSNFNNKYNFKFKTKDPKEKEKIKNLFYFLKKNINLIGEKNNELQNYFFINNKNKLIIDDNKINNGNKSIRIKGVKIENNTNRLVNEKKSHIINVKSLVGNDNQLINEMQ